MKTVLVWIVLIGFFGRLIYERVNAPQTKRYGVIIDYPMCSSNVDCRAKVQFLNGVKIVSIHREYNPLPDDTVTEICTEGFGCYYRAGKH